SNFVVADTTSSSDITFVVGDRDSSHSHHGDVLPSELRVHMPRPLRGAQSVRRPIAALPRSAIVVDEWGPYDWQAPKLWPLDSSRSVPLRLQVLGPPGRWRLADERGVEQISKRAGSVRALGDRDTITVTPKRDSSGDWSVTLEWHGTAGGAAQRFSYERFE